jgi:hypothetical protein
VEQIGKGRIIILPSLFELLLAHRIQGIIEIAFDVKVIEDYESIFCMLPDGREKTSCTVAGNRIDFQGVFSAQDFEKDIKGAFTTTLCNNK